MDLDTILLKAEPQVLDEAFSALQRSHVTHYESAGEQLTRQRLAHLFTLVVGAIRDRDLSSVVSYTQQVAIERFEAGFDVSDVQPA